MTFEESRYSIVLLCEIGSKAYGVSQDSSDHDEMGICMEPIEAAMGLKQPFESYVYRTAEIREGRKDAPSQPGDTDRTIYSLRKFMQLALKGNPSALMLLYAPILQATALGRSLRELAPAFASKRSGGAFLGYLNDQKRRLLGERGQKNVNRKELVEKYGFDTKYAAQILRLGYQGIEYMQEGKLTLPLSERQRDRILQVKNGGVPLGIIYQEIQDLEQLLVATRNISPLPEEPQIDMLERWMVNEYRYHWGG